MRSSGPGGQNVNMVNTKCQIRFNLNDADWLSPEIKKVFRKRFVRLLTKQYDVVISSDKSRIQTENQEDCFEKLRVMLMECNKELLESRSPTNQDKKILDNKTRRAAQRRLYAKRMESQNKKNRDPYEFI
ncbi:unnamed protein product [Onchocerca flexuosa]|uniref:Large ribosomal subunit protein mL62 n=1 Tax=Onchocerca flexuosa TaxID=387005 RepID=A0A183H0F9_9BILA|nr:unnamed protein product [Onchocerca flexuosa]